MSGLVRVGSIVRINLRGRRVRGWVVDDDAVPEAPLEDLRPIAKFSSDGPPVDVVRLAEWAAWRWAGPRVALLRAASPPNAVRLGTYGRLRPGRSDMGREAKAGRALVVWPPASRMAELLRTLVAPRGSTIIVIPDVERGAALAEYLRRAGLRTVEFHGTSTDAERTAAWVDARDGECVVVGGRIAAWAAVPDLAAAVVVDEGDEAMKEERAPTWNARDVVAERAERCAASLVLVTPTPTLEALELAPVSPRKHAAVGRGWGRVIAVDRRDDPPGTGLFSPALIEPMRQALARGTVVCVLNRKGRARLLACDQCRQLARCDRCGGAMAEDEAGLECRMCAERRPRLCDECGSTVLRRLQPGVSRLREELAGLLPRVEVTEVDASALSEIPAAGALIGTEAVLHRARDAALVAFLDFDQELLAPRFRAAEQALWLLVRAVRLTGGAGPVIVQTRMPDHEVIRAAVEGDPAIVTGAERARRQALRLPPFGALAEVEGEPAAFEALADHLSGHDGVEVVGPLETAGQKPRGLVRAPTTEDLCDALAVAAPEARARGRLRIDVDPLRA